MVRTRVRQERGFTLIEMLVTVGIAAVVMGIAIGGIPSMLKTARADSGLTILATALRSARELSISERRNVQVTFPSSNTVQISRVEYPSGTITPLRTTTLEGRATFQLMVTSDTPDGFGNATATALGSLTPAMFTTDGSFINSQGDVLNGTIFVGITGDTNSARAITIFGPTGALHLWRWDGKRWIEA